MNDVVIFYWMTQNPRGRMVLSVISSLMSLACHWSRVQSTHKDVDAKPWHVMHTPYVGPA